MYEVVVLIEGPLTVGDAHQLADLYLDTPDPTHLHVLLPTGDAPSQVDSLVAQIGDGVHASMHAAAPIGVDDPSTPDVDEHVDAVDHAHLGLAHTLEHLHTLGLDADGEVVEDEPLQALDSVVAERGSNEVVIMTRTHLVSQLLKIDWASSARRRLDVPVLHLLEASEESP